VTDNVVFKTIQEGSLERVPVKGYEGVYEVDNSGAVYFIRGFDRLGRKRQKRKLAAHPNTHGYPCVVLTSKDGSRKTITVHRIVLSSFTENVDNLPQVNHKDGNKLNNSLDNLEWCSGACNVQHAYDNGLSKAACGERQGHAKLTDDLVYWARTVFLKRDRDFGVVGLNRKLGVCNSVVSEAVRGVTWRHLHV
jgi:hypothetical protein